MTQQTLQVIETRLSRQVVQSADNSGSPEILHTAAQVRSYLLHLYIAWRIPG